MAGGFASLKNANKKYQRTHRERVQPKDRKSFGYLEKKKDYKVRAKNYQDNQAALKKLREKALNKNPNEFYFHMINSQVKDGKHFEKKEDLTKDQIKLMQTQDMKYIAYKRKCEFEKIEKLKANAHFISVVDKPKNKKIFFVDEDEEEAIQEKIEQLTEDIEYEEALHGGTSKKQEKQYKELKRREERYRQLTQILQNLTKKNQALKCKTRIIGTTKPRIAERSK